MDTSRSSKTAKPFWTYRALLLYGVDAWSVHFHACCIVRVWAAKQYASVVDTQLYSLSIDRCRFFLKLLRVQLICVNLFFNNISFYFVLLSDYYSHPRVENCQTERSCKYDALLKRFYSTAFLFMWSSYHNQFISWHSFLFLYRNARKFR